MHCPYPFAWNPVFPSVLYIFRPLSICTFFKWAGDWPTASTPSLGDQDFLSGLTHLGFSVPKPLLQGKISNSRQGPIQDATAGAFFYEVVTPFPLPFSTGLGTGYGGVNNKNIIIIIIKTNCNMIASVSTNNIHIRVRMDPKNSYVRSQKGNLWAKLCIIFGVINLCDVTTRDFYD
jgi:hypothetical protein